MAANKSKPELAGLTAAILAGGLGTRLRSVVKDRPKVLAPVMGRPFLAYLLDQLAESGIIHVILCTGYMGEQVMSEFGETYGPLRLEYSEEKMMRGTAGALRLAFPLFQSDPVLVMNGDSICEVNYGALWNWHSARNAKATMLLTEVQDTKRFGRVIVDKEGRITRFEEKDGTSGAGLINAGIYLIRQSMIRTIPPKEPVSLERDIFPEWLGMDFYGYKSIGRFLDIGTPGSYAASEEFPVFKGGNGL